MIEIILYLAIGITLLYYGSEWLVSGSCKIAVLMRISQLIIGLTVVAFGTSTPELIVSLKAAIGGHGDVSIGNVVGSNIANVFLILGIVSMINPLKIDEQILRFDLIFCIAVSIVFWIFMFDKTISRVEGFFLFFTLLYYMYALSRITVKNKENIEKEILNLQAKKSPLLKNISILVLGLAILVAGAHCFVEGAVMLARLLKVSEAVIGLTVVAVGTSLPELSSSIVAAVKKKDDISVGNIIGSNVFNISCIIGIVSMITPIVSNDVKAMDFAFMLGSVIILVPIMLTGKIISRAEGTLLFLIYIAYNAILWPK